MKVTMLMMSLLKSMMSMLTVMMSMSMSMKGAISAKHRESAAVRSLRNEGEFLGRGKLGGERGGGGWRMEMQTYLSAFIAHQRYLQPSPLKFSKTSAKYEIVMGKFIKRYLWYKR